MDFFNNYIFYHIYPLGMAGCPKENKYEEPVDRLNKLLPWISHIKNIGCNSIYIGPLFESSSHGYDTTDYKKVDSRLGTNNTFKNFVKKTLSIKTGFLMLILMEIMNIMMVFAMKIGEDITY